MNLERIQSSEETRGQTLGIDIIDLGIDEEIQELFLVENMLFVISSKKMLKVSVPESTRKVEIKKTLQFEDQTGFILKKCIESKIHHSIYILFVNKNTSQSMICQSNLTTMEIKKTNQINRELKDLKVDTQDPSILYSTSRKNVYKVSMDIDSKQEDLILDTEKIEKSETKTMPQKKKTKNIAEEKNSFKIFYSNPVDNFQFFTFDKEKNFFFICNEKEIKQYDMETKKLLHTFKGHHYSIKQLVFADDFSLMIR